MVRVVVLLLFFCFSFFSFFFPFVFCLFATRGVGNWEAASRFSSEIYILYFLSLSTMYNTFAADRLFLTLQGLSLGAASDRAKRKVILFSLS